MDGIENAFKRIGIKDFGKKIIAYGADGASTNRGQLNGVIALMREKYPWVYFIWCLAHRLELSLKDAIGETCFKSVDEMILRLYYLYVKSPKKMRKLKELYASYKDLFSCTEGVKPKKASGLKGVQNRYRQNLVYN